MKKKALTMVACVVAFAPRRCVMRFDFSQPGDTITSAKGLVDGHDFRMPLTRKRGDKSFAEVDADFSCFRRVDGL